MMRMNRVLLAIVLALIVLSPRATRAVGIVYVGGSGQSYNASGASTTGSITAVDVGSGLDRVLIVGLAVGAAPTYVKFNTTETMTQVGTDNEGGYVTYLFCLANPTAGSHPVDVLMAGATPMVVTSAAYAGVDQTACSSLDSHNQDSVTSASPLPVSTTTVAAGAWLVGAFAGSPDVAPTAGTATTVRAQNHNGNPLQGAVVDSNTGYSAGSTASLVVDPGATSFESLAIISMAPSVGGPGGSSCGGLLLRGMGC